MKRRTQAPATPEPPEHLTEKTKALSRALVPDRVTSPGRLALLEIALRASDRADEASAVVARDGVTIVVPTTGTTRAHPALRIQRQAHAEFLRIWTRLGLETDEPEAVTTSEGRGKQL